MSCDPCWNLYPYHPWTSGPVPILLLAGDVVSDCLLDLGDLLDLEDLLDGLEDLLLELFLRLDGGLVAALPLGELAGACEVLLEDCLLLPSG